jgi:proline iminopeptidase
MIIDGYINYLDSRTYYRIAGPLHQKKPPLLLLHGGPGSTHNYFEVLDRLAYEDDRQLISYDQIGCGNSYLEGRPELWRMDTWIGELKAVRKALGLEEVYLLGQSWGGMLLLEYLCRHAHPGVKGIVLSSTLPSSRLWGEEQARMIRQLPERMQRSIRGATARNDYSSAAYQAAEARYMELHASGKPGPDAPECLTRPKRKGTESYLVGWGPNEFTPTGTLKDFDVTELLDTIDVPTLIFSGGSDLCTPYIAKTMFDRIPNARWELFRDCRHTCFVEDTETYIRILKDWLNT